MRRSSIWGCGGENIVRRQRTPNPLECELTHRLNRYRILDRHKNARTDQDLTRLSFVAKTRGDVGHRADSGVVEAPFKSDSAKRCISVRYTDAEANIVAQLTPLRRQGSHGLARFERHLYRAEGWVIYWDRVVEDHHHTVTSISFKRAAVLDDDFADGCMAVAQQCHYIFRR